MPEPWHQPRRRNPNLRRNALLVLVGIFGLALIVSSWPPDPPEPRYAGKTCDELTLADRIEAADLILTGSVFIVIPSQLGAEVVIEPERVYRGSLPERGIRIVAVPAGSGGMGVPESDGTELQFASTQPPYLLFLHQRADNRFDTRACLGSRLLGSGLTVEERAQLGDGQLVDE